MNYIYNHTSEIDLAKMGGKATALSKLVSAGFLVPEWFVISPQGFIDSLMEEQKIQLANEQIEELFTGIEINNTVAEQISQAIAHLHSSNKFAVRSSGASEDGNENSFAGQFESYLEVKPEEVLQYVVKVWKSGFSKHLIAYYKSRGLTNLVSAPAVIVQKMVNPSVAGVLFTVDPVNPDSKSIVVSATAGLADKLMSGEENGDNYHLDRHGNIISNVLLQLDSPVLTNQKCKKLVELALKVEQYFKIAQDIEWAMEEDNLYLLQARAITTIKTTNHRDKLCTIWDNSNIVESYSGVVLPLTFSFASNSYAAVYRKFSQIMGVSKKIIEDHVLVYQNTLGYINGRVYYNLLNWYKMLALFPGFALNQKFMEQMMGVEEPLPDDLLQKIIPSQFSWQDKIKASFRITLAIVQLIYRFITLQPAINHFYGYLNEILKLKNKSLKEMTLDELGAYYRKLENALVNNWNAPLINDFFCMIFFGISRKLLIKFCKEDGAELHNNFLKHQGNIVSAEPAKIIKILAKIVRNNLPLLQAFRSNNSASITLAIQQNQEFSAEYLKYMDKFADRCLGELKLESLTVSDDPSILHHTILAFAESKNIAEIEEVFVQPFEQLSKLLGKKRLQFYWVKLIIKIAIKFVRNRENLRFERTRVFARVRKIFLEIGSRLVTLNKIEQNRDIFYLEVNEVLGFIEGRSSLYNLSALINLRKIQNDNFKQLADPPNRFYTYGAVCADVENIGLNQKKIIANDDNNKTGLGCCPGVVRAKVKVINNPATDTLIQGEILVAKFTDPGWIMFFANAAGILVERGSLLSHSAIVAREMGIPAIVSIAGLMEWLKTGDEVEFNGSTGVITKL